MIFYECDADEIFLKFLLEDIPKEKFEHKHGKGNVFKWVLKTRNCLGLVDKDTDSIQYRKFYERFEEIEYSHHYKYTYTNYPMRTRYLNLIQN